MEKVNFLQKYYFGHLITALVHLQYYLVSKPTYYMLKFVLSMAQTDNFGSGLVVIFRPWAMLSVMHYVKCRLVGTDMQCLYLRVVTYPLYFAVFIIMHFLHCLQIMISVNCLQTAKLKNLGCVKSDQSAHFVSDYHKIHSTTLC